MRIDNPEPPINPFRNAGKVFAEFLESDRRTRKFYAIIICILFALLITSQITIAWIYSERKEHLSIVEVNGETGEIIRKYTPVSYTPTDAQKSYLAREWINTVRRVPSDKIVIQNDLLWAYAHTAGTARDLLDAHFRAIDPYNQEHYRAVENLRSLKKSEDSYQVTWREASFTPGGVQQGILEHTALITISHGDHATTDENLNPTSLHVVYFDWTVGGVPGK